MSSGFFRNKFFSKASISSLLIAICWPLGRPPYPKWVESWAASRTNLGSIFPKSVSITEQQISAEWNPGCMAFLATTTPPTGMIPSLPVGQASGIKAPFSRVGVFISFFMVAITLLTLSSSNSFSGWILTTKSAGILFSGIGSGSLNCSKYSKISVSSHSFSLMVFKASPNHFPWRNPQLIIFFPVTFIMFHFDDAK